MNTPVGLERYLSYINCQLQPSVGEQLFSNSAARKRAVTISRQSGCGAHAVAEKLAQCLQAHAPHGLPPWTIFDRNLVEQVLADHQLPERLA